MKNIETSLASLGFEPKETAVLVALYRSGRSTVSRLSRTINMPRTTIATVLESLAKKAAIFRVRVGNHHEWEAVEPKMLYHGAEESLRAFKILLPELETMNQGGKEARGAKILFYRGTTAMQQVFNKMLELKRGDRVYSFEGSRSTAAKLKVFKDSYAIRWQSTFKKKGIILEGMVSERLLDIISSTSTPMIRSLIGRAVIVMVLPPGLMDFDSDIYVFRDTVLIITPEEKTSLVIEDRKTARAFKQLLTIALTAGRRVDLNAFAREVLEKRKLE